MSSSRDNPTSEKNYSEYGSAGQLKNVDKRAYPAIVLVSPEIPQNTGNIARLSAALKTDLHLIEPLGFELSDKYLKRAGLDYWPEVRLHVHANWEEFLEKREKGELYFFSTKARQKFTTTSYTSSDFLVFGSETAGLADTYHQRYKENFLSIPMDNPKVRSLNLANSVAIAIFEAKRQLT